VGSSFTGSGAQENGWDRWLIARAGDKAIQHAYGESFVRYFLGKSDPLLDTGKFDFAKDIAKYNDARTLLNATDPNLGSFRARRQAPDVFRLGRHGASASDEAANFACKTPDP
jgi:hypothetical protein